MSLRKGSGPDRIAGNIFFVSMLCMSAAGAYMAVLKSQMVVRQKNSWGDSGSGNLPSE